MYKLKRPTTTFMQRCRTSLATTIAAGCTVIIATAFNPAYAQNVTTVAGNNGQSGFAGDTGPATAPAARLSLPWGLLARTDGSLLIADTNNNRVRKVDVGSTITTYAGTGAASLGADNVQATASAINSPISLVEDSAGNVYIGGSGAIRKVTPAGIVTTIAGNNTQGNTGDTGLATAATVGFVTGLAFDSAGNLFFTDSNSHVVRKIAVGTGIITRIAGTGVSGAFVADNVAALTEPLNIPNGIVVAADDSLIVTVFNQYRVRRIVPGGNITTIAGTGASTSSGDNGPATAATLNTLVGIASDGAGGYFVAEYSGHRVRKIAANGTITTVIGSPTVVAGTNSANTNTGDGGPATSATVNSPTGLSRASNGNLFISSYIGHTIRKIAFAPLVTTPGPSVFNAYLNTTTAILGTITPAGEQTVAFGGKVAMTVTANPRHVLRVASNCDYVQTSRPVAFVPIGTGAVTFDVTVNGPCQMEATFTPLIPKTNVNSEAAANALFMATEQSQNYIAPTAIAQTASTTGQSVTFKAWVTDIAGVPYPSATNVITFKANGTAISGCSNVPLTLRGSNVIHIREAVCVTSFAAVGNSVITSEFAGDTYNFPAASSGLNHSVSAAP